ncbi:hypothetical protein [Bradyrhizobium sp.]|uniref:hypothetical protein n=1 Tax=Bradyrhizobium sp. TaxID=376 RepID=UPI0026391F03|nr:hypothetical protein [Bradyrhizobium sp.]
MWTIYEEIGQAWIKAYADIKQSPDDRGVFAEFILNEENEARTKAAVDLQPWFAILELGLEWLSYVHVALTNDLENKSEENRYRYLATWALVGSAVSFGLSIRLLCACGFDAPAKALLRSYVEALLLCLAVLDDKQLAKAFVESETDAEVKNFLAFDGFPKEPPSKSKANQDCRRQRLSSLPSGDVKNTKSCP